MIVRLMAGIKKCHFLLRRVAPNTTIGYTIGLEAYLIPNWTCHTDCSLALLGFDSESPSKKIVILYHRYLAMHQVQHAQTIGPAQCERPNHHLRSYQRS